MFYYFSINKIILNVLLNRRFFDENAKITKGILFTIK